MDVSHLRYFKAIAEHGSLSATARALGCSQPTLTLAVQRLEARFGTTLLLRTPRGVEITSTGRALLRAAGDILNLLEDAEQSIHGLEHGGAGRFVVGCNASLGAYFLPPFLSRFMRESPGIEVVLWTESSPQVLQRVLEHDIHFGLVVNPRPCPDLVMRPLFRNAVDAFVREPAGGIEEARERLRAGPIIATPRLTQTQAWLEYLSEQALGPPPLLGCGDLTLARSLTRAGLGIGLLPRRVANEESGPPLHRLHPELPCYPDRISLIYRADLHRTRAALRLKEALVAHGAALDGDYDDSAPVLPG